MKAYYSLALALPWLSCGCSAWLPNSPAAPATLTAAPIVSAPAADAPAADWPSAQWWQKYADPTLNALMTQGTAVAPSIATAEARFASARESVRITAATQGLQVDLQADASRQRLSDNGLFPARLLGFQWYNQADLGIKASYSFDWWHKRAATIAAATDESRAAQAERSAATLALTAAIADSYFGWQADQAQLAALDAQLQAVSQRQHITAVRIRAELESPDAQYALDSELAALRANRAAQAASAELRRVMIAALLGVDSTQLPAFTAQPLPAVAAQLPDNVRVDLLARRADIMASRWRIEAAEQSVRAARAEFMPDVSINALAGLSSIDLGKLLNYGSRVPTAGVALHLPIFDAGLRNAQFSARTVQLDAAIANYNATVVSAAREVATQALSLQQLAAQGEQRQLQINAAQQALDASTARHRRGLSDGRMPLAAWQAVQQQRAALLAVQAAAVSADINLQLALGGGYRQPDAANAMPTTTGTATDKDASPPASTF